MLRGNPNKFKTSQGTPIKQKSNSRDRLDDIRPYEPSCKKKDEIKNKDYAKPLLN